MGLLTYISVSRKLFKINSSLTNAASKSDVLPTDTCDHMVPFLINFVIYATIAGKNRL